MLFFWVFVQHLTFYDTSRWHNTGFFLCKTRQRHFFLEGCMYDDDVYSLSKIFDDLQFCCCCCCCCSWSYKNILFLFLGQQKYDNINELPVFSHFCGWVDGSISRPIIINLLQTINRWHLLVTISPLVESRNYQPQHTLLLCVF